MLKRGFDIAVSGLALLLLWPLILFMAILVRLDSPGPSFFLQIRIGRNFRRFRLWKLRSMTNGNSGAEITSGQEARITRIGGFLRRFKFDELPQLWNVFCGDMSFVGPRPEVATFVEQFRSDYEEILRVRPGITDPASIRYRHEAELLGAAPDPVKHYTGVILPDKIKISKEYLRSRNFRKDMAIIIQTITAIFRRDKPISPSPSML
ncbi:sugar transferase [Alloacidobacterium dinghuense]|uniref:Sugar transferase n=1 Tax=Alloacidobacterium dinghuense TaxID=2763107 RepID=A0A7G8BE11_9BACT|nr:sugar transferase [Alloacidobacterium dinghuense]QNI30781.1 sugar transferase [Alloacidobacterium dinghuense]